MGIVKLKEVGLIDRGKKGKWNPSTPSWGQKRRTQIKKSGVDYVLTELDGYILTQERLYL